MTINSTDQPTTMKPMLQALAAAFAPDNGGGAPFVLNFIERAMEESDLGAGMQPLFERMVALVGGTRVVMAIYSQASVPDSTITWSPNGSAAPAAQTSDAVFDLIREQRTPLWIADAQIDARLPMSHSISALELRGLVGLPVIIGNHVIAAIAIECPVLGPEKRETLVHLAELATYAKVAVAKTLSAQEFFRRLKKFELINEVSLAITATIQLESLLRLIIQHSLALSGGDHGYILLGEGENLECLSSLDSHGQIIQDLQISRTVIQRCVAENKTICILDTGADEASQTASVMALDLKSVMCVPLVANNERLGVLYISSNAITKTFTSHDQSLLESIASQATLTIRNAQLLKEQQRQIIQLEEALSAYRKAEKEATTDMLTGLHNRRYLEEQAARQIEQSRRGGRVLSVVMLDVDHFKQFNDTYGHAMGDEVLKVIGRVLPEMVRIYDVPARFGGEEFVVLCPDSTGEQAMVVAERIRQALAAVKLTDQAGEPVRQLTASLGIATLREGDIELAQLLERADTALYSCKAGGRNQSQIWHAEMPTPEEIKRQEREAKA